MGGGADEGGGRMMLTFCFCVHIVPPAQTTDNKTCIITYVGQFHSGDAFGSFCVS